MHSCEVKHTVGLTAADARRLLTGVREPARLAAVADLDLPGHVGDLDLDSIVETLTAALDVPIAVVNVVTPDLQTYPAEIGVGAPCTRVPDGVSFCAEVVETGRPVQVADARTHPVYRDNPLVQQGVITSYAGVPLVHRGAVIGAVSVFDDVARTLTDRELRVLAAQARLAATVLTLRWTASHDPLTGLANRRRVAERVPALVDQPAALLFVDVDDFKQVNDTFGHAQGDALLRELAVLLEQTVAGTDGLAVRWGGDEFLVLLPGAAADTAASKAQLLVRALPTQASLPISVSVGVASASSRWRWDELLAKATTAARARKAIGKNGVSHAPAQVGDTGATPISSCLDVSTGELISQRCASGTACA
jgi:diguanylate cyclase (GGDEF)-like protein